MTSVVRLGFCSIAAIETNIDEVIIDEGVELDGAMVHEYNDCLNSRHQGKFGLLVNKLHNYTYSFEAQTRIADLENIAAMAVIAYKPSTRISTESLISMPRRFSWNIRIFDNREEGLLWLRDQLANPPLTAGTTRAST